MDMPIYCFLVTWDFFFFRISTDDYITADGPRCFRFTIVYQITMVDHALIHP